MKNNMFKSKKGVSPLIATVLLIAFAVALGAVVMNWGKAQLDTSTSDSCPGIDFIIENVGNQLSICYNNQESKVSFLLRNVGTNSISKLRVTLISNQPIDPYNQIVTQSIDSGETKRIEMNYPSNFGQIQKVRITPLYMSDIYNPLSEKTCNDKSIEILQIPLC
jgi:flagellin-like protein